MASVNVLCSDGIQRGRNVLSVECPHCRTKITPIYLFMDGAFLFCRCPESRCDAHFLLRYVGGSDYLVPNHPLSSEEFSTIITELSPDFVRIYNQAYAAEQMCLSDICGVGYRKALEFLIKDYILREKGEEERGKIKLMNLTNCISAYVNNENIRAVSSRAVWLGNDEAHYIRKWEDKDVQDLKGLILLTVGWIEQSERTLELLRQMPERK